MDPELAMALRVSMEEERARQEAASKATADQDAADAMAAAAGGDAGGKGDAAATSAEESKSGGVRDVGDSTDADAMQVSSWRFRRREFLGWRGKENKTRYWCLRYDAIFCRRRPYVV